MEATAKYDFDASADDELSFKKGECLKVLQTTGNWYKAEHNEVKGFVPKNFININLPSWYQEDTSRSDAEEKLMSQPVGAFLIRGSQNVAPGNFSISVRHAADVQHLKVLRDSRGQYYLWSKKFPSLNQMVEYYKKNSVSKHVPLFLQEAQQQQRGGSDNLRPVPGPVLSPRRPDCTPIPVPRQQRGGSDNLRPVPGPVLSPRRPDCTPIPVPRQHKASALQVRALYSFQAEETDELEFTAGDIIKVLECPHQAWWKGQLRGKTGLFPSSYTKPI